MQYCTTGAGVTSAVDSRLSSVYNQRGAGLALDGDPTTCATSALQDGPWWLVDMDTETRVRGVRLLGQ